MEKRPRPIGQIFVDLGLISPDDVERALAYQQERGGYFGDALIELGLLTHDQVKWGLADQYDIPFVHLQPENIDPAVAARVPADWAREHLILPVLRDGNAVTIILTAPPPPERLDEVRRFTRAERIEAAVSTAATIHRLIDSVHDARTGARLALEDWLSEALEAGAERVGISVRAQRTRAWYRNSHSTSRMLQDGWAADLHRLLSTFPDVAAAGVRQWPAILSTAEGMWRVECSLAGQLAGSALEWTARIGPAIPTGAAAPRVDEAARQAFREVRRQGAVAVRVDAGEGVDAGILEALLPALPGALDESDPRSLHLADRAVAVPPGLLTLPLEAEVAPALETLEPFSPDALTLDLRHFDAADLAAAHRVTPLVVFRSLSPMDGPRTDLDLCLCYDAEDRLIWTLRESNHAAD